MDILVNAAGVTYKAPTLETDEADWSRVMDINLTGTLRACQIFGIDDGEGGLRAHREHCFADVVCGVLSRGGVFGEQGGGGLADQGAGD